MLGYDKPKVTEDYVSLIHQARKEIKALKTKVRLLENREADLDEMIMLYENKIIERLCPVELGTQYRNQKGEMIQVTNIKVSYEEDTPKFSYVLKDMRLTIRSSKNSYNQETLDDALKSGGLVMHNKEDFKVGKVVNFKKLVYHGRDDGRYFLYVGITDKGSMLKIRANHEISNCEDGDYVMRYNSYGNYELFYYTNKQVSKETFHECDVKLLKHYKNKGELMEDVL